MMTETGQDVADSLMITAETDQGLANRVVVAKLQQALVDRLVVAGLGQEVAEEIAIWDLIRTSAIRLHLPLEAT